MKFIGHLDLMRYFQKVMRRANVDICYSQGFSPHQLMSFALPLGVGATSDGEYMDIDVNSTDPSAEMLRRINAALTDEIRAASYRKLPEKSAKAMSIVAAADYTVRFREGREPGNWDGFAGQCLPFLEKDSILVQKKAKKGERETDIRPMVYELAFREDKSIWMRIAAGSMANLRPEVLIKAYMDMLGEAFSDHSLLVNREDLYALSPKSPDIENIENKNLYNKSADNSGRTATAAASEIGRVLSFKSLESFGEEIG